jgi:IS5 family transposase
MRQFSFADAEFAAEKKVTRRERFLDEMERVVPWTELLKALEPFATTAVAAM